MTIIRHKVHYRPYFESYELSIRLGLSETLRWLLSLAIMDAIIPCALIILAAIWVLLPAAIIFWLVADILLTAVITHPVDWLLIIGTITSALTWAITRRVQLS